MNLRRFLVLHFTAGWTAQSSIDFWRTAKAKGANAHIVIDRNGDVYQCRPFNRTAGHAGTSFWRDPNTGIGYNNLNTCSIGIEIANMGQVKKDAVYHPTLKKQGFEGEMAKVLSRHKNGGPETYWELFPEEQIESVINISRAIVERYNLDDVVGHEDIAPKRKNDPGPAFPMLVVREALGFSGLPLLTIR